MDGEPQEDDPDWLQANPPAKEIDPKIHFQVGANQGKWLEYDDRGVPTKNIKKKKPTKKEKDGLEQEYLEARKKYQQYLQNVEEWEQKKLAAEAGLEKTDRIRWAFRQTGADKTEPIGIDELEEVFKRMGWDQLTKKELQVVRKAAQDYVDGSGKLDLPVLREYTAEKMPVLLLEERLNGEAVDEVLPDELYSPRTWRHKLNAEPASTNGDSKKKKSSSSKKDSPKSPRGSKSPRRSSQKEERGSKSPRSPGGRDEKKEKKSKKDDSPKSPRGASSPRGGSPSDRKDSKDRERKAKKSKG